MALFRLVPEDNVILMEVFCLVSFKPVSDVMKSHPLESVTCLVYIPVKT